MNLHATFAEGLLADPLTILVSVHKGAKDFFSLFKIIICNELTGSVRESTRRNVQQTWTIPKPFSEACYIGYVEVIDPNDLL